MKKRKQKRPRSLRLSLHPLSLEEALKKALSMPFVAPKKAKKLRPKKSS
jgi:hypothetical protein